MEIALTIHYVEVHGIQVLMNVALHIVINIWILVMLLGALELSFSLKTKKNGLSSLCLKPRLLKYSKAQPLQTMVIANSPSTLTILENGDRLNRDEFERRYTASNIKKAELIEGIVHMASPLRFTSHGKPHSQIIGWLVTYQSMVAGLEVGIEPTVRLDDDNEPQPDAVLFRVDGNAKIDDDGYILGAPELIAEIAASTVSYDLHSKKRTYERNGVKEYIVWRTLDRQIDWFILENGKYNKLEPDAAGIIRSQEFSGLWLNVKAILSNDMSTVLKTLQTGLSNQ